MWEQGEPARRDGSGRPRQSGELRPWRSDEREAMGGLLVSVPWQLYCTWQFRDRIGEDGVLRQVRWWLGCLGFAYGGKVGWMIGLERTVGAHSSHAHGLVVALDDAGGLGESVTLYTGKPHEKTVPFVEPFWLMWQRRHGGGFFKLIEGDGVGCAFYCAKYSAKRGEVYFSSGLERWRKGGAPRAGVSLYAA